jgi:hypothetical protein
VVLECSNGTLGGVAMMNMWMRQLEIDVRGDDKFLQGVSRFIVEAM